MNDPARVRRRLLGGVAAVTAVGSAVGVNTDLAAATIRDNNIFVGVPYLAPLPECVRVATTMTADGFLGPYTGTVWADYSPSPSGSPCNNAELGRPAGWLEVINYKGYNGNTMCYASGAQAYNTDGASRVVASSTNYGSCPTTGNFSRAFGAYHNMAAGNPSNNAYSWD